MRTLLLIILLLPLLYHKANGQATRYASKWHTKPTIGVNLPLTTLLKGDREDYLMKFDDRSYYWQFLNVAYFPDKHWGLEFNFQGASSRTIGKRYEYFVESLQAEKGNDFFITPATSMNSKLINIVGGNIEHGSIGLIYRLESNRFFLYPKVSIGVLSFFVDWAVVFLKEKDGNNLYRLTYTSRRMPKDHLCPSLAAAAGYKLSKHVFLNIDLAASYFKTNITFPVTTTDLNSELNTVSVNNYKKDIFKLGLGTGVIIVIK